jgi:hypothetical protein
VKTGTLGAFVVMLAGALVVAACSRGAKLAERNGSSGTANERRNVTARAQPKNREAGGPGERATEARGSSKTECAKMMRDFGMRIAHSPDDDRLISFVKAHMKRTGITFPRRRDFVIWKRDGASVSVTVADVDEFCAGKKSQSPTYRVVEHADGYEVLYMEAQI